MESDPAKLISNDSSSDPADIDPSYNSRKYGIDLPTVQNRPSSSATKRIKMLSFLDASGTRAFIISLATERTLRAAVRFAFGDPKMKRIIIELPERW